MKKLLFLLLSLSFCFTAKAQWQQANGPYGQNIRSTIIYNAAIFATTSEGIFTSSDNGSTWSKAATGFPANIQIHSLFANGSTLFSGTTNGLYISTNNGSSWARSNTNLNGAVMAMAFNGNTLFAGTPAGVFTSTNNGATWSAANNGLAGSKSVKSLQLHNGTLFAATSGGVFQTTTNGALWQPTGSGIATAASPNVFLSFGLEIFAGTDTGIFKSTDNGATWSASGTGLTNQNISTLTANGATLFAGTQNGLFASTDNGNTWNNLNVNGLNNQINTLAITNPGIFAGTARGLFLLISTAGNWTAEKKGLTVTIRSLAAMGTEIFAASEMNGIYATPDNGSTWVEKNNSLANTDFLAIATNGIDIFAGSPTVSAGGIFRSSNTGNSWQALTSGLPANASFNSFAFKGTTIFAKALTSIYRSTDNGSTWTMAGTPPNSNPVYAIASNSVNVFAATPAGMFVSSDNGDTWTPAQTGIPAGEAILTMAANGSVIYGGSRGKIFATTNNGATWTVMSNGIPANRYIYAFAFSGNYIFTGTSDGVFVTSDNGANWTNVSTGLQQTDVWSLAVSGQNLYVAVDKGGVYKRSLSEFGVSAVSEHYKIIPLSFYPNPTSGKIMLNMDADITGLTIQNIVGQTVYSVPDFRKNPTTEIDLSGLPKGIYIIKASSGKLEINRKIVLH